MKEGSSRAHWFFVSRTHYVTLPLRFRHAVILYLLLSEKHQLLHFGRRNTYLNHLREWVVQIHLTKTENPFQVHCPIHTLFSRVCIHIKIHHLYWSKFHVKEKSEWSMYYFQTMGDRILGRQNRRTQPHSLHQRMRITIRCGCYLFSVYRLFPVSSLSSCSDCATVFTSWEHSSCSLVTVEGWYAVIHPRIISNRLYYIHPWK